MADRMRAPLRVLVLEDQPADCDLMLHQLRRAGFAPLHERVCGESEYLAQLEAQPELILADYYLPQFNALRALKLLQERSLDIPFIVVTGSMGEEVAVECMQQGASDYLLKDRLARLGPAVTRALQQKQLREQERRAELALLESKERFQHLVEAVRVIPWELEPGTGRFTYVGPQAAKVFGYAAEEWYADGFWPQHVHADDRQKVLSALGQMDRPAGDHEFDCRMPAQDGRILWMHVVVNIPVREGRPIMLRGFLIDISEMKKAEELLGRQAQELARSNAELEQFAYVASHDLQEPLRMVSSYAQLLAGRYRGKLDPAADEFIGFIREGAARMHQLICDLLAYSRVNTNSRGFAAAGCETVFNQALANLRVVIGESGAVVTHDPLPVVQADATQLLEVFQNLLGNAIKFRDGKPPRVHVSAQETAGEWVFSVSDNGIGIEPQYFERIFVIFQRLHTREKYGGTGIGLTICKRIVERHGGRMWVESRPGEGATFRFTIPKEQKRR